MPGISFQKTVTYCELLNSTLRTYLEELPHLKEESERMDALVVDVKVLDREQQELKGRLKEITRRRREAEKVGQELRSRVVAQIQGKLGFTNENLHAFGILPRKPTRRRAATKEPKTPPPTNPPVAPPAGATPPEQPAVPATNGASAK